MRPYFRTGIGWLSIALTLAGVQVVAGSKACAADQVVRPTTAAELHQAFVDADANPSDNYFVYLTRGTYDIASVGTLTLNRGQVFVYGGTGLFDAPNYILDGGNSVGVIAIDGAGADRPSLSLTGVTVSGGLGNGDFGGGIKVYENGYLDLSYTQVVGNRADFEGAGVFVGSNSSVYVWRSSIADNTNTQADPNRTDCGGGVTSSGGGIGLSGGYTTTATIKESEIKGNRACRGGGISAQAFGGPQGGPQVYLYNSTITNNFGTYEGGGIYAVGTGRLDIYFSSIVRNTAADVNNISNLHEERGGGGISFVSYSGAIYVAGSIIAQNTSVNPSRRAGPFGVRYNNNDCQRGIPDNTDPATAPSDAGVIGNIIGALDLCTFLGSPSWPGIGTESNPMNPGLQVNRDVVNGWANNLTVARPISGGLSDQFYKPDSSTGNGELSLPCRTTDELSDTAASAPTSCSAGAVENSF